MEGKTKKTSKSIPDSELASLMYAQASTKAKTEAAFDFERTITVKQFIDDLKLRYPEEFESAVQTWIYFYTKEDVHKSVVESTYGLRTTKHHYITFRPSIITFISIDKETNKPLMTVKRSGLDVYSDFGVRFETHIPKRIWDKEHNRYSSEVRKDEEGNTMYKLERELKENVKVNFLRVLNAEKSFKKPKSKWDLQDDVVKYYEWKIDAAKDNSKAVQYMLKNIKVEQFKPLSSELDKDIDEENAEMVFE